MWNDGNIEAFPKEIYDELLEKAEDDFILQNLTNYNNICSLIEKLKKNIAKTLRAGWKEYNNVKTNFR